MTDEEEIADAMRAFNMRAHRTVDRIMTARGASFARTKLLLHLALEGALRSADLATALNISPRTITEAIDGLERDGLVRRQPHPQDRRAKQISLTPAGQIAAESANKSRQIFLNLIFGILNDREKREIVRILGKMTAQLDILAQQDFIPEDL